MIMVPMAKPTAAASSRTHVDVSARDRDTRLMEALLPGIAPRDRARSLSSIRELNDLRRRLKPCDQTTETERRN